MILKLTSTGQVKCAVEEKTVNWIIVPFPNANAGNDTTVCTGSSFTRKTSLNPDWTYEWRTTAIGAVVGTNAIFNLNATQDSTLYLSVKNSNGCIDSDNAIITTIKAPVITLAPKICYYAPVSITANVANAPIVGKYDWKKDGVSLSNSSSTLLINSTGTYSYTFELDGGCFNNDEIEALEPPTLVVKDTSGCQNGNTAFVANVIPGATYLWGPTEINNGTNKFKINAGNGVSNFKVLVIEQNGCRDSVLANITLYPFPDFTLTGSDLCPGQTKQMQALLDNPSLSSAFTVKYQWKDKNKTTLGSTISTLDFDLAGKYYAIASIEGCSVIDSIEINKSPNPIIGLQAEYKYCSETDGVLTLQPNIFSEYTWRSDDGLNETSPAISVAPEKSTYYWLRVKNAGGCTDSTQLFVKVVCKPRVFLPNVMTPESNDVNSTLKVFGKHYTNFAITVFSRWGEVIFHSEDPEKTWNGDYLNEKMPLGNYQWQVTYEGDTEEYKGPYKKSGDVTLVR